MPIAEKNLTIHIGPSSTSNFLESYSKVAVITMYITVNRLEDHCHNRFLFYYYLLQNFVKLLHKMYVNRNTQFFRFNSIFFPL